MSSTVFCVAMMAWTVNDESFYKAKVVMDELGWGGAEQLVPQYTLLMILNELSYSSWSVPITDKGASAEGTEMMPLVDLPFK